MKACHENLFNSNHYLDVFIVGVGGVGGELVEQVKRQQSKLADQGIVIRVCGLANSKGMLLNSKGIDLNGWRDELATINEPFSLPRMVRLVQQNHIINPVFIDCTSDQAIADQYADFLSAGFHVITPNKKANTAGMAYYQQLRKAARATRRKFMYDTTVGAGLPVIENLQNLIAAGDELENLPVSCPAPCPIFSVSWTKDKASAKRPPSRETTALPSQIPVTISPAWMWRVSF